MYVTIDELVERVAEVRGVYWFLIRLNARSACTCCRARELECACVCVCVCESEWL